MDKIVSERFLVSELPEDLRSDFPDQTYVRVTIERARPDEEVLAEFYAKIEEGLDDVEAGRVHTIEEVQAHLQRRFGAARDAAE